MKVTPIDKTTSIYSDPKTNDPVAVVHAISDKWSKTKKQYHIKWHPTFASLYPDETNSLTHRNFNVHTSAGDAAKHVESKYKTVINGSENPDPLKISETDGIIKKPRQNEGAVGDVEMHHFFVHDPQTNNIIASLHVSKDLMPNVGTVGDLKGVNIDRANIEYLGDKPTEEQEKVLAMKHPGGGPITLLKRVKTWLETKDKQPRFIGEHTGRGVKTFKTHLPVDQAAKEYVEHLKKSPGYKDHTFEQISPHVFSASKASDNVYSDDVHEIIDGRTPKRIIHMSGNISKSSYDANKSIID